MLMQLIVGALMNGSVFSVVGMGYSLIYKASGMMSLCQGDMLMFGAFLGLTLYEMLGLPFWLTVVLVAVSMFFLGVVIQSGVISSLLKKGTSYAYVILCTLSISMMLQNSAMLLWGTRLFKFPSVFNVKTIKMLGVGIAPEQLLVLGVSIVAMLSLHFFMKKTPFGTAMRAAALNDKAASAVGINVPLTKGVAWGISSALAGVIGCVLGPVYGVYTTMGVLIGQKGFAGAVTGGYGNMYGSMIGGMLFGFLEIFVAAYVTTNYKDFVSFGVLIIILIFMPTGILKEKVLE